MTGIGRTIWKFPLTITGSQFKTLPRVRQLLTVQVQDNIPMLWASVNPQTNTEEVEIKCYPTGGIACPHPDDKYIATIQHDGFVWHFFEVCA